MNPITSLGPVHLAYNPSYSVCFFSVGTIFFSHKKSANSIFQLVYQLNRTGPSYHGALSNHATSIGPSVTAAILRTVLALHQVLAYGQGQARERANCARAAKESGKQVPLPLPTGRIWGRGPRPSIVRFDSRRGAEIFFFRK
jgi:hypothetical protein